MASSDLGALGSRDGSPVEYQLGAARHRAVAAAVAGHPGIARLETQSSRGGVVDLAAAGLRDRVYAAPPPILPAGTDFFLDVIAALAVGLAAVWLLSNYLRQPHRLLTFLCVLLCPGGFQRAGGCVETRLELDGRRIASNRHRAGCWRSGQRGGVESWRVDLPGPLPSARTLPVAAPVAGRRLAGDCRAVLFVCAG